MMCIDLNDWDMCSEEIDYWCDKYPALQKIVVSINYEWVELLGFEIDTGIRLYVFKLTDLGIEVGYHYQKKNSLTTMFLKANPTNEDIEREFKKQPIDKISVILKYGKFWYPDKREYVQRVYDFLKTNFYDLEPAFTNEVNNFLSDYSCKYTPNHIETENVITNQTNPISKAEVFTGFDETPLNEYILAKDVARFIAFEKEFIKYSFFKGEGIWNRTKKELACFIQLLWNVKMFRQKKQTGKTTINLTIIARFFMERYKCEFHNSSLSKTTLEDKDSLKTELQADLYTKSLFR